jgi:hypothetical protein
MSLKFPVVRPDQNEIVEPDDLNLNLKQFVDELNGNLTHENLSNFDLDDTMFEDETFSEVYQSSGNYWTVGFKCSQNSTSYIREDEDGTKLPFVKFFAERDGYVIVDFFSSFKWDGTGLIDEDEMERFCKIEMHQPVFHSTVYWGHESRLPPGGWIGAVSDFATDTASNGALGIHPNHKLQILAGTAYTDIYNIDAKNFPQGRWCIDAIDRYAIRFRVLSNGHEVCESGWIHNGTDQNGMFITGVIPVRAGINEIRTEVSVAQLEDLYGTSFGIRSKDSNLKKGEFYPSALYSSRKVPIPLPKKETKTITKTTNDKSPDNDLSIIFGIDCTVKSANLVVQYRKG